MHKVSNEQSDNARAKRRYVAALLIFGTNGLITSTINLPSPEIVLWRTLLGCAVLLVCANVEAGCPTRTRFSFYCGVGRGNGDKLGISVRGVQNGWRGAFLARVLFGTSVGDGSGSNGST